MPRNLNDDARAILDAGITSVLGDQLLRSHIRIEDDSLWIDDLAFSREQIDRIVVVGAGKASGSMAAGLVEALGDEFPLIGHLNVPEGCDAAIHPDVELLAARPAGVNEPTELAVEGTGRMLELLRRSTPRDLVLALISGGGSALMCQPAAGITLADKLAVIRHLSRSGADIIQLNTVRKHLSGVKGGRLAAACRCPRLVTLVLSDVLGDPIDLIASGPTVADPSTPADALEVLARFDPDQQLPVSVYQWLATERAGEQVENQSTSSMLPAEHAIRVIGNNAVAVDSAGIRAESLGYNHVMHTATKCEGLADDVGRRLADLTWDMLLRDPKLHRQDALITGGEPVVELADPAVCGRGGRNQQLVLAAYQRLLELSPTESQWSRLAILSAGTDGEDGPTDAAGACLTAEVHHHAIEQGLSPDDFLRRNDAYSFFEATGGLVFTGPTGTNVCDLRIALVEP